MFQDECAQMLAELDDARTHNDAVRLGVSAHTLKGMLGNMGAAAAAEAALKLEATGRSGSPTDVDAAYARLAEEIARLLPVVAEFNHSLRSAGPALEDRP